MARLERTSVNREQIVDAILVGHELQQELGVWGGFGRYYKDDSNPEVASVAQELFRIAIKMRWPVEYWRIALRACFYLRVYAWPLLRTRTWDLREFWKIRFEEKYMEVEKQAQKLGLLLVPEQYDEFVQEMVERRVRLRLPQGDEEQRRARVERFKAMLRRMTPMNMSSVKELSRAGSKTAGELMKHNTRISEGIRAYARRVVADLPPSERTQEKKEIEKLMKWVGWLE